MKAAELVFIPLPAMGHLVSTVEMAKLLIDRDDRLSITVLIVKIPTSDFKVRKYIQSLSSSTFSNRIRFINLPNSDQPYSNGEDFFSFLESQKPHVKEVVSKLTQSPNSPRLAGFVIDMMCTQMIDVANDLGVSSYLFFTSSAAYLGLVLHLQDLFNEQQDDPTELKRSDVELAVPSFVNLVPARVFPSSIFDNLQLCLGLSRDFKRTKGIIVNSFFELESHAVNSLYDGGIKTPHIYPVGPILNLKADDHDDDSNESHKNDIVGWLDDQPSSSVVFLCFGSRGCFGVDQVKEIACALERGEHRFVWSLRKPNPKDNSGVPGDYENLQDLLPQGFLDRTADIGKVIGWAPQAAILGHPAVGGFVSHCGWNSILESIWFGVPIATWPMYAEQQVNAFHMVVELGLAVEIKLDYEKESEVIVRSEEIERGIHCVMEHDSEKRKKVKEMSGISRSTMIDGGSSYSSMGRLIQDVINNIPK